MARKPRIQFEGAFYHIIVRGNQRQDIFGDESDRYRYLERLGIYKDKCGFLLYAYVLMSNHVGNGEKGDDYDAGVPAVIL